MSTSAAVNSARLFRRVPREAWLCGLVACLNAVCWSFLTPPFQVPDEPDHFAYVQQLAEHRSLPDPDGPRFSTEETQTLTDLHFEEVSHHPGAGMTISTTAEQRLLEADLARARGAPPGPSENAGLAGSEPPLYYALQLIPYELGSGGTLLDRLALMRLLSALMAGFTAMFAFLFLREALPAAPWSWVVGGLGVALFPLLGFLSGAVNPDGMLYAVAAALLCCLARAFRHGLTRRLAVTIGVVMAVGLLTKLNFIGLLPGALVGLVVLTRRASRVSGKAAYVSLALALGILASPVCAYALRNLLDGHPAFGAVISTSVRLTKHHGALSSEASYIWQLYLPRLPGMGSDFTAIFTARQLWFNGLVGVYGWLETFFPGWVYDVALLPAGIIAALCARALIGSRALLWRRLPELGVYLLMLVGVMVLVGADGYLEFPGSVANYAEPRYLLPLLALWGAVLALAARGAGRRWGPVVGAAIVMLALAHDVFSQLLIVSRYYI
jgi:4-amino-4-deoxy-L-arabinose transferase-like glycosyltransferase